jgi:transcriptional regulator with XRE-family HTH domain
MSSKARRRSHPRAVLARPRPPLGPVRRLRSRLGLTQEQYARLLGVTWATVSRWERGQATPDAKGLAKLGRLQDLVELIGEAIRPEDVAKFLMTPHPELRGHPPVDLIENEFGFEAVKGLVLAAQSGAYR